MIKVMLVDDEVSALDHIKSLIDWKENNFDIVAECTNPKKALLLFEEHRPDIIIVDICMPIMDGLEFSRKIVALNKDTIILLLTSYKDFEYAQQALEIGIFKYLLKHEVKKDTLIKELLIVKDVINERQHNHSIINRQIIKSALEGKLLHEYEESEIIRSPLVNKKNYVFILIKQDLPYPVLPLGSKEKEVIIQNTFWRKNSRHTQLEYFETITLEKGRWGMLVTLGNIYSSAEIYETLYSFTHHLQKRIAQVYGITVSALVTIVFSDLFRLQGIYQELAAYIPYLLFKGREKIMIRDSNSLYTHKAVGQIESQIATFKNKLMDSSNEEIKDDISQLFNKISQTDKGLEELRILCDHLVILLEDYRKSNHIDSLVHTVQTQNHITENWYAVLDIQKWFSSEFISLKEKGLGKGLQGYSRIVRKVVEYIYQHYHSEISLATLSEVFGISSERLRHVFKEETGKTVTYFITRVRMEKASSLIKSGQYKIYEIAEMTGYNTSQYFSQVFRKVYGITPFEYAEGKGDAK